MLGLRQQRGRGDLEKIARGDDVSRPVIAGRLLIESRVSRGIQCAILCSAISIAGLLPGTQARAADATTADTGSSLSEQELDFLPGDNPGSIIENLKENAERKDHLFQFPGVDRALKSWYRPLHFPSKPAPFLDTILRQGALADLHHQAFTHRGLGSEAC